MAESNRTITRWVVPCSFEEKNRSTDPIEMNLTSYLIKMLENKVWERKFEYGFGTKLQITDLSEIDYAKVKIFPKFMSGSVNVKRIPELIGKECGTLPSHLNLGEFRKWNYHQGFIIFEIGYTSPSKSIPTQRDILSEPIPNIEHNFIEDSRQKLALLKELASFFLAGMHLSFHTTSLMSRIENYICDGFYLIQSGKRKFGSKSATSAFTHVILVETQKIEGRVINNFEGLVSVWHHNLWSLKRFLCAVGSNHLSIDNLLDLIYALEGLFEKSTSTDFIKSMCLLNLCSSKNEAREVRNILDAAYKIRNDIVHSGLSFDPYDKKKVGGKEVLIQNIYWKMKGYVSSMLIIAITKLLKKSGMKNLRFNTDDFLDLAFKK